MTNHHHISCKECTTNKIREEYTASRFLEGRVEALSTVRSCHVLVYVHLFIPNMIVSTIVARIGFGMLYGMLFKLSVGLPHIFLVIDFITCGLL